MGLLNKEQILQIASPITEEIDVPEWGGKVKIRELSLGEFGQIVSYEGTFSGDNVIERQIHVAAKTLSIALLGEDGTPLFTEDELVRMGRSRGTALTSLMNAILNLSGVGKTAAEEVAKNSASGQSGSS